jgi:hypothetical protein
MLIFRPCKSSANDCGRCRTLAAKLSHAGRPSLPVCPPPAAARPGADIANGSRSLHSCPPCDHPALHDLTFSNKNTVTLDTTSNQSVVLGATAGAAGERFFDVNVIDVPFNAIAPNLTPGANEVDIQATPSTVATSVAADGTGQVVNLRANSGHVTISGNSSTTVDLGENAADGLPTTAGINANVLVTGVGKLQVSDNGNNTTQENVRVTESTIRGSGLFGNSAVTLTYRNTTTVVLNTGQLADTYTVAASSSLASFSSFITIPQRMSQGRRCRPSLL